MPKQEDTGGALPSLLKQIVAENATARLHYVYRKLPNETAMFKAAAKKGGLGKNTVERACDKKDKTAITLGKLEKLAKGLELSPYQLLVPYLDAQNPQIAGPSGQDAENSRGNGENSGRSAAL